MRAGALLLAWALLFLTVPMHARETINIGTYSFQPFAYIDSEHQLDGVIVDLIDALNELQSEYQFNAFVTSPSARYMNFKQHQFDAIAFQSMNWSWQDYPISASQTLVHDRDIYIARQSPDRTQEYFDELKGKSIIIIRGYHYGFSNFNNDPQYLKQNFYVSLTHSNESSIKMLLAGRGDIAVVTESYLNRYLQENPDHRQELLISETSDQEFDLSILVRDGITLTPNKMNTWLEQLKQEGMLARIWNKWGLDKH